MHVDAPERGDQTEVVFACLPSREASLAVAEEVKDGSAIKVYIECSTLGRPTMEKIAKNLTNEQIEELASYVAQLGIEDND